MLTRSKSCKLLGRSYWHLGPGRFACNVRYRGFNSIIAGDVAEYHLVFYRGGRWWGFRTSADEERIDREIKASLKARREAEEAALEQTQ